jgi:uncharacterized ferredoxin-like protein
MKDDKKLIAMCGLDCRECPAYLAWKNNDEELRKKTAKEWGKIFNSPRKAEDINCVGCVVDGEPHFVHCGECGVRKCGLAKGVKNCGLCGEFETCEKIASLHKMIPKGKKVCDSVRNAS